MNECKLNVRIITNEKLSIDGQIELVKVIKSRLAEILPEGTKLRVSREVSDEEIMNALR